MIQNLKTMETMMETNNKIGKQIKDKLTELSNTDGLKRTQRWLASQIGFGEVELSNKLAKHNFTQAELDLINDVLKTKFKI